MKKKNSQEAQTMKPMVGTESAAPAASDPKTQPVNEPFRVPPILLEGDDLPKLAPEEKKFTVAPGPASTPAATSQPESKLPDSYGTGNLRLTARDPRWLYAHWDLSRDQQQEYNSRSREGHMVLRVHPQPGPGLRSEIHLQPGSRHWFLEVANAGTSYQVELGYYGANDQWVSVSTSAPAITPPDRVSEIRTLELASGPAGLAPRFPSNPLDAGIIPPRVEWIPALDEEPARAGQQAATRSMGGGLEPVGSDVPEWTVAQEEAFERLTPHSIRTRWVSSLEISESIRREIEREISSAQFGGEWPLEAPPNISSPLGGEMPQIKAFWFNVNAELIIYGATQPDARVTIGGQPIELRPDGTFTCRLALPDGEYELDVAARSVRNDLSRAQLKFSRSSRYDETTEA